MNTSSDLWSYGLALVHTLFGEQYLALDSPIFGITSKFFNGMRETNFAFIDLICRLLVCLKLAFAFLHLRYMWQQKKRILQSFFYMAVTVELPSQMA